jgi:steroid delta-isomerase-like uncharacterized protein
MGAALDLVNRFFTTFAAGDLDAADDCYADDCEIAGPTGAMTKAEHRMFSEAFRAGLPDARMVVDHALEGTDEVFVQGRFVGTHSGDLVSPGGTLPASGNALDLRFGDWFQVAGGRIVRQSTYFDQMDMLGQLGALPG